jgi:hypothetical protein
MKSKKLLLLLSKAADVNDPICLNTHHLQRLFVMTAIDLSICAK